MPIKFYIPAINEAQVATNIASGQDKSGALYMYAKSLFLRKRYQEAIPIFLNCLLLDKDNEQICITLALSYREIKKYDKAIDFFEQAKKLSPLDPKIYYELAVTYNLACLHQEAMENIRKSIELDDDNPIAMTQLAITHQLLEEYEFALSIFDTISAKFPSFIKAIYDKAELLFGLERYQEASATFHKLLQIVDYPKAYSGIAVCFDSMGMYSSALRYYRKYLELYPHGEFVEGITKRIIAIKKLKRNKLTEKFTLC